MAAVDNNTSSSFKYKSSLLVRLPPEQTAADGDNPAFRSYKNAKILVHLNIFHLNIFKYISSFFRSLELALSNKKLQLEISWTKNCIMSSVGNNSNNDINTLQITKTELYVPVVTLKTDDNAKLNSLLTEEGFEISVFWNEHKSKIETHTNVGNKLKRIVLDSSFPVVNRLSVLAYRNQGGILLGQIFMKNPRAYSLPRVKLTKFNVLIDGRNFCDQPISSDIKKYEELLKLTIGKGENYETGCLLDYDYYKKHYSIIACDLSRQRELGPNPRSAQQIEIVFMLDTYSQILTILEKSKVTKLKLSKGATKVL